MKVGSHPVSVHSYHNKIFVGLEGLSSISYKDAKLRQLDETLINNQLFVDLESSVTSVQACNDELYVWLGRKDLINVYDMSGTLKRAWKHCCPSKSYNKLAVVSGKVVVQSAQDETLTVYDLHGQLLKQIKCPGMSNSRSDCHKGMAVCGDNSVIVTDWKTETVFRVNIDSGEVMWTSKHLGHPLGVVCYNDRYALVTNKKKNTSIWILDADTGMRPFLRPTKL